MTSALLPDAATLGARLVRERAEARALRDEIAGPGSTGPGSTGLGSAAARRLAAEERFHTWGLVDLLLDEARRSVLVEPRAVPARSSNGADTNRYCPRSARHDTTFSCRRLPSHPPSRSLR